MGNTTPLQSPLTLHLQTNTTMSTTTNDVTQVANKLNNFALEKEEKRRDVIVVEDRTDDNNDSDSDRNSDGTESDSGNNGDDADYGDIEKDAARTVEVLRISLTR